ncbi:Mnd1 family protein [Trichomonas vaginalis G3]|uniref:Mnd1 family protein n=3 Tax=Trichomonas vaginalis TaxID=5722 RepID=A2DLP5_TRIV3|nr:homologous recombination protein, MND1-like [Trichomonas vaginalis G3]ABC61983.1 MND1-like protein [Trichomonas vaginalis]AEW27284.1 MND1A [Trichomonas vaginalis]AEW27285.1 MND1A [Trichomonas vaginalis]EAY18678.1 Mnd1 family protein [Trichomonas vaginalis G3]KAI5522577.1 homologous recombination protein, MND1-like [Trichomonas vaginalis G3]|eukprot:XP_001579664.1 Mnd1 family protein [Trichomonas vaginalis G3]
MSRKKGMSREEKLMAMQELMMESADIWTLKDLERDCPKKKGITAMSVKEVLQELCDNDLVSFEKIGSGNFYWCFPSEAFNKRKVRENKLNASISEVEQEIQQLQKEIQELEPGREPCEERTKLDSEISTFSQQLSEIQKECSKYEQFDPAQIKKTQEQIQLAKDAANRWTDNIFVLKSWATKTYNIEGKAFNDSFQIPEDFDYVE